MKQLDRVYAELSRICDYPVPHKLRAGQNRSGGSFELGFTMDASRVRSFSLDTCGVRSDQPVDLVHLRRYTLGDKALEYEVLQLFIDQLPQTIASLRSAATEREWKMAAHTLKGSSRAVGAWRLATLAEEAEALVRGGQQTARSEAILKLEAAASEARSFVSDTAHRA
jgi:HPt (histidine-containing phosphotransfer) domain-containing protein